LAQKKCTSGSKEVDDVARDEKTAFSPPTNTNLGCAQEVEHIIQKSPSLIPRLVWASDFCLGCLSSKLERKSQSLDSKC
jgi:hypothetical protein